MKSLSARLGVLATVAFMLRQRRREPTRWAPPAGVEHQERLAVRILGDPPARVVLLHGMFNSGRYWGQPYDRLSRFGRLVVPDLLGFGRSPQSLSGYTAERHADAVAETIRACGPAESVVIGAHSVGCLVAIALATRHPELVTRIVAFAPPLYRNSAGARRHLAKANPLARLSLTNEALARRVCELRSRHADASVRLVRLTNPSMPAPLARDRVLHSWQSYSGTLANLVIASTLGEDLADLAVPFRMVVGRRDRVADLPFLTELADRFPHLSLSIVGNAGHDLPLLHPERCVPELEAAVHDVFRPVDGRSHPSTR